MKALDKMRTIFRLDAQSDSIIAHIGEAKRKTADVFEDKCPLAFYLKRSTFS